MTPKELSFYQGILKILTRNIHSPQVFACNRASVEVQVRGGGASEGSFMKFTFLQTPEAQVHGPVLQSKIFAFRCLQSNTACIILGSILPNPLPPAEQRIAYDGGLQLKQQLQTVTVSSSLSITPVESQLAQLPVPMQPQSLQVPQQPQIMPPQSAPTVEAPSMPMFEEEPSDAALAQPFAPHPLRDAPHPLQQTGPSSPISGTSTNINKVQQQQQQQPPMHAAARVESPKVAATAAAPAVTPSELKVIYPSLKPNERRTLTQCRYCSKEFHFVSEHLIHLKMHVSDVDSVAEMSLKIWVQDRKLKCDKCKKWKTKYTLDYAQHVDTHAVPGLCCAECRDEVETPAEYARHMEIHHHSVLFAQGALPDPEPEPGKKRYRTQVQKKLLQI